MSWPEMQNQFDVIDQIAQQQQAELAQRFNNLNDQIKNKPEDLNKISKESLEAVEKYISLDKACAFDMYINILESLKNTDKLWNRDEKSLNNIKSLIEWKYNNIKNDIWEYQLNNDVFNEKFDFNKLTEIWSKFQKWTTSDWFRNIPKDYDGTNQAINKMCEWKLYTPKQLVKWLYDKNEARRNKISTIVSEMYISKLDWINSNESFDAWSDNAKIIVREIKSKWWELANDYWEYGDFINKNTFIKQEIEEQNTNTVTVDSSTWTMVVSGSTDKKVETTPVDLSWFDQDAVVSKINEYTSWYNIEHNKGYLSNAINKISNKINENPENPELVKLVDLLKKWNIRGFQQEIWLQQWNGALQADGKLGPNTLKKLDEYLNKIKNENKIAASGSSEIPTNNTLQDTNQSNSERSIITPEKNLKYSKDFIWKNIDNNIRSAYVELFEVSNYTNVSTFFKKDLNSITNDDIRNMQENLITGIQFDYKWIKMVFRNSDVDWNFWPKTLAALNALVKFYANKRFTNMEKSINDTKLNWTSLNRTFIDYIQKEKKTPITLIDSKIVRKNWQQHYSIFDQNSWIWKWVSVMDDKYESILNFEKNLIVNQIPKNSEKDHFVLQQNMTHPASTTYVSVPNVPHTNSINIGNRWTDQWNSVVWPAK